MKMLPPLNAPRSSPSASRHRQGFSLVEVTLALGIMAFCIVPIFGLLPVGINSNQVSINQTRAASVAANVCADMRATLPSPVTTSPQFNLNVSATSTPSTTLYFSEAGDAESSTLQPNSRYRVTVTVTAPPASANGTPSAASEGATWMNVLVSWPAAASVGNAAGTYQVTTSVNRS